MIKIPVYKPSLNGNEKKYVDDCLTSTWISSKGEYVKRFENAFSKLIGVNYGLSASSGTTALHLALLALNISKGDEVIVPTLTYIASVNAIKYTGAKPVFIDAGVSSWNLNEDIIEEYINDKTKAILVVHLYGQPCNMEKIMKIAKENNLYVIEDCAEAIGSEYMDKYVGSYGDVSAFSFFGNKTITTGEGGMLLTNNTEIFERALKFRSQGLDIESGREYWHDVIGYNYRMTNICAAIGLAQLERIYEIINKKNRVAKEYISKLNFGNKLEYQKGIENGIHTYWMFSILLENEERRNKLRGYLLEKGIETRPIFYPVHMMPCYKEENKSYIVSEEISKRGINLPSYPDLTKTDIEIISDYINEFI